MPDDCRFIPLSVFIADTKLKEIARHRKTINRDKANSSRADARAKKITARINNIKTFVEVIILKVELICNRKDEAIFRSQQSTRASSSIYTRYTNNLLQKDSKLL